MKILIIGGTRFLGRFLVEEALQKGHEITLFNRGNNKGLFPNVEEIYGDRNTEIQLLENRKWDAVIDTCGYLPKSLDFSLEVLAKNIGQYVFISSISVYKDFTKNDIKEDSETLTMSREEADKLTLDDPTFMTYYGELKFLCEQALLSKIPAKSLIIRPGLIVGPYDGTDRFTYWVDRVNRGGTILAPGNNNRMVQFIDVRDLAKWTIHMVENQKLGIYNATGIDKGLTMESMLLSITRALGSETEFIWAHDKFLLENEVGPWMELPLWLPECPLPDGKIISGMLAANTERAVSEGLTFRSVEETAKDTFQWFIEKRGDQPLKAGMNKEKEEMLLIKLSTN